MIKEDLTELKDVKRLELLREYQVDLHDISDLYVDEDLLPFDQDKEDCKTEKYSKRSMRRRKKDKSSKSIASKGTHNNNNNQNNSYKKMQVKTKTRNYHTHS